MWNKALSDFLCNVKFSLSFTTEYKEIWKENLVIYQKSLKAFLQAPLQFIQEKNVKLLSQNTHPVHLGSTCTCTCTCSSDFFWLGNFVFNWVFFPLVYMVLINCLKKDFSYISFSFLLLFYLFPVFSLISILCHYHEPNSCGKTKLTFYPLWFQPCKS